MLVWLAAGVVQQVVSAVPQLSARLAPLLPFWALAATALLSYAFISQAPGAVSPDNAAPGVALFAALHGLPQLGGSTNKLVAAFVVRTSEGGRVVKMHHAPAPPPAHHASLPHPSPHPPPHCSPSASRSRR